MSISEPFNRKAECDDNYYRGEYPKTGAFHLTRHWLAQLALDAVCLAWWVTIDGGLWSRVFASDHHVRVARQVSH